MTTCRNIVKDALLMTGVLPMGADMSSEEANMGLNVLQGVYDHISATRGNFTEVYKTVAYEAQENERVYGSSVTLPATIVEEGVTRKPKLFSIIQVVDTTVQTSIFDFTGWVRLDSKTLDDTAPLVTLGRLGLASLVAEKFVDMFGGEITAGALKQARDFKTAMTEIPETEEVEFSV